MVKILQRAVAEVARLSESDQERIGKALLACVEKLQKLRDDLRAGIASLDAGEGGQLDVEEVISRARKLHGAAKDTCSSPFTAASPRRPFLAASG